ncbi:MAG: U32 family peptidase [Victivallales bacterium]|nr:U32 family peptidase [Victivallales bacterium]
MPRETTIRQPGKVELLSPAGDFESLAAAVRNGADSIYFGVGELNMRAHASANFALKDIPTVTRICRKCSVNPYLALNTVIYNGELGTMRQICDIAKSAGVAAVIASDMACISYANSIGLPVHVSVQANISNTESLRFFAKFADVAVLARELDLDSIRSIADTIMDQGITGLSGKPMRIELFIHGALCVSVSGTCHMSLATYNSSANRGECFQNCRRRYRVLDDETGQELVIDNKYVMSPKDICTIRMVDKLMDAGVSIMKIEGRGRSADYVAATTRAYRQAIDTFSLPSGKRPSGKELDCLTQTWEKDLESVFNRGFWHGGYYMGDKTGEWSALSGNRASFKKTCIGYVSNFFSSKSVAEITVQSDGMSAGDTVLFTGKTTGAVKNVVNEIWLEGKPVPRARKGDVISVKTDFKTRRNDKVYVLHNTWT